MLNEMLFQLTPEQLFNSTLYVTLEPCNHFGKQPPCSQLIVDSHIKRVVIAEVDPHKLVTGKGIATLKENGIEVTTGVLNAEVKKLNEHYNYFYKNDRPWITLKQATSLDYKVSAGLITNGNYQSRVYEQVHPTEQIHNCNCILLRLLIISLLTRLNWLPPIRMSDRESF